jgi:hypothetical protein
LLRGKSIPDILANSFPPGYPCRCLCLGFSQITRTTLLRRMILHLAQIFFTEGLTFISAPYFTR